MTYYRLDELPINTKIYHRMGMGERCVAFHAETVGECLKREEGKLTFLLEFHLQDGLWASRAATEFWKKYPHYHPHYTLFEALYTYLLKN